MLFSKPELRSWDLKMRQAQLFRTVFSVLQGSAYSCLCNVTISTSLYNSCLNLGMIHGMYLLYIVYIFYCTL